MLDDVGCHKLCLLETVAASAGISARFILGILTMSVRRKISKGAFSGGRLVAIAFLFVLVAAYITTAAAGASRALAEAAPAQMPVVATFPILADMVSEIGGEHVQLTSIIGLGADAHAFEPTPEHARALAGAQVLVMNGLGFEAWLPRLLASSGFKGKEIVASQGVKPRRLSVDGHAGHGASRSGPQGHDHHEGGVDPHAWQSLVNGKIYARNIAEGLAKADPDNAAIYFARASRYIEEMTKLDTELHQALGQIPADKRKVVVLHDALGYFGDEYKITFIPIMGISSQAEASARNMAEVVDQIREEGVAAVFLESGGNPKLVEQIARETDIAVGGTLYVDTLSASDQPAGTYLGMIKWNAGQLIYALKPKSDE